MDHENNANEIAPLSEREREQWASFGELFVEKPLDAIKSGNVAATARYEWKDEYGTVPPRVPELEKWLFKRLDGANPSGDCFEDLLKQKVTVVPERGILPVCSFEDAGLHPAMLENVALAGYSIPTPIQQYCIPAIMEGLDLLACAQTGSGKTAAFLIPIISKLMGKPRKQKICRQTSVSTPEPLVLIVAPTRELATQLFLEALKFSYRTMLRPCVIYGGADSAVQKAEVLKGCDVLVGTPGRLLDFLEKRIVSLQSVRYIVIDEADEMLDMGFGPQIRRLLQSSDANENSDLQVLMFSATYPAEIKELASEFLDEDFVRLNIGRVGSTHKHIGQTIIFVEDEKKHKALIDLLADTPPCLTLIFVNDKRTVDNLDFFLHRQGLPVTSIHGGRNQCEREDALTAFRCGKTPILIATSVASRGLDIKNVMHVINFDLPTSIDEYVHRIGRTARIGNSGYATSFYSPSSASLAPDLVKILEESSQKVPDFLRESQDLEQVLEQGEEIDMAEQW